MAGASFTNATALVTGGARRIGRAVALSCAAAGMNVVVHYRKSKDEAKLLVREIEAGGGRAWACGGSIGGAAASESLVRRARALCGDTLSLLVNNASLFREGTLEGVSLRDISENIRVNAWAPLCLSRAFAKTAKKGCIVNLLDARIAGHDRGHAAYILSKHLLAAITKVCALEFAPRVRVNAVAPGLILPPAGKTNVYLDSLAKRVPLKSHGEAADIARAVMFLAQSPFVTGEIIFVDGGRHLLRDAFLL
jgi:pteridine reductase